MTRSRTWMSAAVAAVFIGLAAPVLAHGPGFGAGPGAMRGAHPERAEVRMQALRDGLKLAPNQIAAFDAYAARVKSAAETRAKLREEMHRRMGDAQAMSELRVTMTKHNAEAAQELHALRTQLYGMLSAEQKNVLDSYGPGAAMGQRFGGGPGMRRGCAAA